jgi:hypothetical protein
MAVLLGLCVQQPGCSEGSPDGSLSYGEAPSPFRGRSFAIRVVDAEGRATTRRLALDGTDRDLERLTNAVHDQCATAVGFSTRFGTSFVPPAGAPSVPSACGINAARTQQLALCMGHELTSLLHGAAPVDFVDVESTMTVRARRRGEGRAPGTSFTLPVLSDPSDAGAFATMATRWFQLAALTGAAALDRATCADGTLRGTVPAATVAGGTERVSLAEVVADATVEAMREMVRSGEHATERTRSAAIARTVGEGDRAEVAAERFRGTRGDSLLSAANVMLAMPAAVFDRPDAHGGGRTGRFPTCTQPPRVSAATDHALQFLEDQHVSLELFDGDPIPDLSNLLIENNPALHDLHESEEVLLRNRFGIEQQDLFRAVAVARDRIAVYGLPYATRRDDSRRVDTSYRARPARPEFLFASTAGALTTHRPARSDHAPYDHVPTPTFYGASTAYGAEHVLETVDVVAAALANAGNRTDVRAPWTDSSGRTHDETREILARGRIYGRTLVPSRAEVCVGQDRHGLPSGLRVRVYGLTLPRDERGRVSMPEYRAVVGETGLECALHGHVGAADCNVDQYTIEARAELRTDGMASGVGSDYVEVLADGDLRTRRESAADGTPFVDRRIYLVERAPGGEAHVVASSTLGVGLEREGYSRCTLLPQASAVNGRLSGVIAPSEDDCGQPASACDGMGTVTVPREDEFAETAGHVGGDGIDSMLFVVLDEAERDAARSDAAVQELLTVGTAAEDQIQIALDQYEQICGSIANVDRIPSASPGWSQACAANADCSFGFVCVASTCQPANLDQLIEGSADPAGAAACAGISAPVAVTPGPHAQCFWRRTGGGGICDPDLPGLPASPGSCPWEATGPDCTTFSNGAANGSPDLVEIRRAQALGLVDSAASSASASDCDAFADFIAHPEAADLAAIRGSSWLNQESMLAAEERLGWHQGLLGYAEFVLGSTPWGSLGSPDEGPSTTWPCGGAPLYQGSGGACAGPNPPPGCGLTGGSATCSTFDGRLLVGRRMARSLWIASLSLDRNPRIGWLTRHVDYAAESTDNSDSMEGVFPWLYTVPGWPGSGTPGWPGGFTHVPGGAAPFTNTTFGTPASSFPSSGALNPMSIDSSLLAHLSATGLTMATVGQWRAATVHFEGVSPGDDGDCDHLLNGGGHACESRTYTRVAPPFAPLMVVNFNPFPFGPLEYTNVHLIDGDGDEWVVPQCADSGDDAEETLDDWNTFLGSGFPNTFDPSTDPDWLCMSVGLPWGAQATIQRTMGPVLVDEMMRSPSSHGDDAMGVMVFSTAADAIWGSDFLDQLFADYAAHAAHAHASDSFQTFANSHGAQAHWDEIPSLRHTCASPPCTTSDRITVADFLGALELGCRASVASQGTSPSSTCGDEVQINSAEDIDALSSQIECGAGAVDAALGRLVIDGIPQQVADQLGQAPVGIGATDGQYGAQVAQLRADMQGLAAIAHSVSHAVNRIAVAFQIAKVSMDVQDLSMHLHELQNASTIANQITACLAANAKGASILGAAGGETVGAIATCTNSAVQIGLSIAMTAVANAISDDAKRQAYLEAVQQTIDAMASLDQDFDQIIVTAAHIQATLQQIEQLNTQASRALADALLLGTDGHGREYHANTVMRRHLATAAIRASEQFDRARHSSYVARRVIEAHYAVDLSSEVPWADDVCTASGVDWNAFREELGPDGQPLGDDWSGWYIGDYVARLRNWVLDYAVGRFSTSSSDTMIVSLRDDVLNTHEACEVPSWNLLRDTEALDQTPWTSTSLVPGASLTVATHQAGTPFVMNGSQTSGYLILDPNADYTYLLAPSPACAPSGCGAPVGQALDLSAGDYLVSWYEHQIGAPRVVLSAGGTALGSDAPTITAAATSVADPWMNAAAYRRFFARVHVPVAQTVTVGFSAGASTTMIAAPQVELVPDGAGALVEPHPYQPTGEQLTLPIGVCEDTDGSTFRSDSSWTRGCVYECPEGFAADCASGDHSRAILRCFRETTFDITEGALEGQRVLTTARLAEGNYNYRFDSIAVNLVGLIVHDCEGSPDPSSCYANADIQYTLLHNGPFQVRDFAGNLVDLSGSDPAISLPGLRLYPGRIEHARALAAERYLTNPETESLIGDYRRAEMRGLPLTGQYTLRIWESPELRFDRLEDIQMEVRYTYWTRQH